MERIYRYSENDIKNLIVDDLRRRDILKLSVCDRDTTVEEKYFGDIHIEFDDNYSKVIVEARFKE